MDDGCINSTTSAVQPAEHMAEQNTPEPQSYIVSRTEMLGIPAYHDALGSLGQNALYSQMFVKANAEYDPSINMTVIQPSEESLFLTESTKNVISQTVYAPSSSSLQEHSTPSTSQGDQLDNIAYEQNYPLTSQQSCAPLSTQTVSQPSPQLPASTTHDDPRYTPNMLLHSNIELSNAPSDPLKPDSAPSNPIVSHTKPSNLPPCLHTLHSTTVSVAGNFTQHSATQIPAQVMSQLISSLPASSSSEAVSHDFNCSQTQVEECVSSSSTDNTIESANPTCEQMDSEQDEHGNEALRQEEHVTIQAQDASESSNFISLDRSELNTTDKKPQTEDQAGYLKSASDGQLRNDLCFRIRRKQLSKLKQAELESRITNNSTSTVDSTDNDISGGKSRRRKRNEKGIKDKVILPKRRVTRGSVLQVKLLTKETSARENKTNRKNRTTNNHGKLSKVDDEECLEIKEKVDVAGRIKSAGKSGRLIKENLSQKTKPVKKDPYLVGENPYKCEMCSKTFMYKSSLTTHLRLHECGKSYKCDLCSMIFVQKNALKKHLLSHTMEKPLTCDLCDVEFFDEKNMKRHKCRKKENSSLKTKNVLEKSGYVKEDQSKQQKKRGRPAKAKPPKPPKPPKFDPYLVGENPYKCEVCLKYFMYKSSLQTHRRLHTGEKPFKCDHCGLAFARKDILRKHNMSHTGEMPFHCNICGAKFLDRRSLQNHKKSHDTKESYKCIYCDIRFDNIDDLDDHQNSHKFESRFASDVEDNDDFDSWFANPEPNIIKTEPAEQETNKNCDFVNTESVSVEEEESSQSNAEVDIPRVTTRRVVRPRGKKEKNLKCDVCGVTLAHSSALQAHKKIHTGEKPYKCDLCGQAFSRRDGLRRHKRFHTREKPYPCEVCDAKFADKSNLMRHKRSHKGEKPFKCEQCGERFTENCDLREHRAKHIRERCFKCSFCGLVLAHSSALQAHYRIHTGEKPYKCEVCGEAFARNETLQSHKAVHTGQKPYTCKVCGKGFSYHSSLLSHKKIHTGERPYKCETCGAEFIRKDSLVCHTRSHTGEKPYICDLCGAGFAYSSALQSHKLTHIKDKPFKCENCGVEFSRKSNLRIHQRVHLDDTFKCEVCNTNFENKSVLQAHMWVHKRDKPYICDICGKRFTHSSGLHAHYRKIHVETKCHKCDICGAVLAHSSALKAHRRIHTGEKPYKCEICHLAFSRKDGLQVHRRIHTGEKPFKCEMCGLGFTDSSNLLRHKKTHNKPPGWTRKKKSVNVTKPVQPAIEPTPLAVYCQPSSNTSVVQSAPSASLESQTALQSTTSFEPDQPNPLSVFSNPPPNSLLVQSLPATNHESQAPLPSTTSFQSQQATLNIMSNTAILDVPGSLDPHSMLPPTVSQAPTGTVPMILAPHSTFASVTLTQTSSNFIESSVTLTPQMPNSVPMHDIPTSPNTQMINQVPVINHSYVEPQTNLNFFQL